MNGEKLRARDVRVLTGFALTSDIVDSAARSRMMAGIPSANTRLELRIRKALHAKGFRYRLHPRDMPGKPDIVFPRYRAAIFMNGCFWHGHDCRRVKMPCTRADFWKSKIGRNRERDLRVRHMLKEEGWRTLTIWECSIRGRYAPGLPFVIAEAITWIQDGAKDREISEVGHHSMAACGQRLARVALAP